MADRNGRVWGSIPGIANRARIPVEDARIAIDTFLAPDPDSRTPDHEGRRIEAIDGGWRLLNHEKYRAIRDEEATKEAKRNYINDRRARERASSTVAHTGSTPSTVERGRDNAEAEAEAYTEPKQEKTARKRAARSAPPPPCPDGVHEQVWKDWLALRKAKNAPVTQTVIDGATSEAEKAGMPLNAFLAIWCARGSQGLQADWLKPAERQQAASTRNEIEPEWRRVQRERNEAFAGPYAASRAKPQSNVIEMENGNGTQQLLG